MCFCPSAGSIYFLYKSDVQLTSAVCPHEFRVAIVSIIFMQERKLDIVHKWPFQFSKKNRKGVLCTFYVLK